MTFGEVRERYLIAVAAVDRVLDRFGGGGDVKPLVDALHDLELASCQLRLAAQIERQERV